ncbi:L-asparaginase/N4-(beta-N-acetylglucosaminyl)-L-asparaginase [Mariniphaga anaerophila]|uniref:L-asparaginase/N4-(Beta-N-acetylglucosaminyl)-L-asparaginase n=1 Tax=Mariniphaga anaerophila TaxID=1484053 RepID=A0A1M4W8J2_9BACT|nr:N(4)-(beta-N-acetylglucosaminyl)-L-asparaginase [Mariniphaga anaerophila]SHE77527.1 L-asparaginase/N4-(beta-N-acetylglucosaminyl)-L-asparaginase [Mariniphaga anaerophila]
MALTTRRLFLAKVSLGVAGLGLSKYANAGFLLRINNFPIVISTWKHGIPANDAAWKILSGGGYALDAVEAGVRVAEDDPEVRTVGYGGAPDEKGKVTLDACIMDEKGNAGSVAYLQNIKNPISVARLVLEKTPHVMLSGDGALEFALENGFKKEKLLTKEMRKRWKKWKKEEREFKAKINVENQSEENHDTISMLAIDAGGRLCGACTTSGIAFKMHGRVGDSPIIGAGLFVDGEVGGAAATGSGELVMKTLGSFLVVEFMRNGLSPQDACTAAVERITQKVSHYEKHQIGYIAISKSGETGAASMQPGFNYAVKTADVSELREADAWFKKL